MRIVRFIGPGSESDERKTKPRDWREWLEAHRRQWAAAAANIPRAFELVWESDRGSTIAMIVCTLAGSLVPAAQAWVGKLIVDSVVTSIRTQAGSMAGLRAALPYLATEFGLLLAQAGISQGRTLAEHILHAHMNLSINTRIIRKALSLDLSELALIAEPNEKMLELLEEEELLVRDEERAGVWRFRHGLLRDVAYESLPKRERERLHLLVADSLLEDASTAARHPRSIAYHLEQAAKASLDMDPKDRVLADRAVEALARAGDLALEASQSRPAAELYERALALAGPDRTWGLSEAIVLANLGEARYWLGEFDSAVGPLSRALEIGEDDPRIQSHASRFLGDIELSIRGNGARAAELLDRALAAARELGDPWTLSRTLLVAGWAPYWRGDLAGARAMFEEALTVARADGEGDPWAEARALGTLATLVGESGDEEECLALAAEALAIAEGARDRFSGAVAHEAVGNALRRMWRLDEAVAHLDEAVKAFRDLGARWELASSLTSRGVRHRLAGELEDAVRDLREALRLCRELKERSIVTWTAASLARALVASGEVAAARQVLAETAAVANPEGPASAEWLLDAEPDVLLADGDPGAALEISQRLLRSSRERGSEKDAARATWWIARVFGPEAVGGDQEVDRARKILEATHFEQALREPDLVPREG